MTGDYQTPQRMGLKLAAIPLPDFTGKSVLDIGTDHGGFAFLAAERGASEVLGLDRNRAVQGVQTDLIALNRKAAAGTVCQFEHIDLGKQWKNFGRFDVVLVMSVYHHVFNNCGDHLPIWFWLRQHCDANAQVIWEGPVDDTDSVVQANVSGENRPRFTRADILGAAAQYFITEYIGPALHEPTREVWRFWPRPELKRGVVGEPISGAGGATAAFEYADGRRAKEIETVVGYRPRPGSLNVKLQDPFWWDRDYYRAQVLDVAERGKGLNVEWQPRWARFYPVTVNGLSAFAFRFEGENYPNDFVELVAPHRLRDTITGPRVTIC